MIIGVTGNIGAGKDTFAQYLITRGFEHISLSDFIREEAINQNLELSRENLHNVANQMRQDYGLDILARKAIQRINPGKKYVVTSIRNPAEVKALRQVNNFILIDIDAPIQVRFARIMERNRNNESRSLTLTQFQVFEERELYSPSSTGQQLSECIKMADYRIINDSDFASLAKKTEDLLASISR